MHLQEPEQAADDADDGTDFLLKDDGGDLDLRLARLEHLMARRPELLSSVVLRQNPHNVAEVRALCVHDIGMVR
jgi:pre-mRNA-splicing factor SYF1